MQEIWQEQMRSYVDTIEKLEEFISLSDSERAALETLTTTWGTTPYFASLMDRDDPDCPIRKQVIPSMHETENRFGMQDYLVWKENRATDEIRPDCIARQYKDRVAFTVTQVCGIYCRHCFRKELVVDKDLKLSFDVDEGLKWIAEHPEVRDILITGGDPFLLSDEQPIARCFAAKNHPGFAQGSRRLPSCADLAQHPGQSSERDYGANGQGGLRPAQQRRQCRQSGGSP
jgi:lysine 2,3-aminomutase